MKSQDSKEELAKRDMIAWLDPSLAEAAHKLLVYQTLKTKAIA